MRRHWPIGGAAPKIKKERKKEKRKKKKEKRPVTSNDIIRRIMYAIFMPDD
jgi:hypothetical protein